MSKKQSVTRAEAVAQVIASLDGPISVDAFMQRALTIRPSAAKNPRASLRNHLRWDEVGKTIVFLDRQILVPLRIAMQGIRFRIPIDRQEIKHGILLIHPGFDPFLPRGIDYNDIRLFDQAGRPLPVRIVTLTRQIESMLGPFTSELPAFDLKRWMLTKHMRRGDCILVTIQDWEKGHFRLEHEPARKRRTAAIKQKNEELANLIFDMLEAAHDEYLFVYQAIPTAYARMSDSRGYPGDHWLQVIQQDPRMRADDTFIRYAESRVPLDTLLGEEPPGEVSFSSTEAEQVFRFKAALRYRPGLWRRIEIQGGQTLATFDGILRDAFKHDTMDHLSGFWKRIRRGKGRRFREVDLGDINPFEEGSAAHLRIAGLGLRPGDELKYVYDFGDWIEHRITLEEIIAPDEGVKYPRIVAQNRPRYQYCEHCTAEGRKTVATWVCIECSNREQRDVLVCVDCLDTRHIDHFADAILY